MLWNANLSDEILPCRVKEFPIEDFLEDFKSRQLLEILLSLGVSVLRFGNSIACDPSHYFCEFWILMLLNCHVELCRFIVQIVLVEWVEFYAYTPSAERVGRASFDEAKLAQLARSVRL